MRTNGALFWAALAALMVLRAVLLFPSLAAVVNEDPLLNGDYGFQAYHASLGVRSLRAHGSTSGYDPGFLAGYAKSPHFSASVVPFEAATLAVGDGVRAAKLVALATPFVWLAGLVMLVAAFEPDPVAVRLAALAGALVFWLSMPFVFLVLGMAGFLIGTGLAFAATGALWRGLTGRGWLPFFLAMPAAVLAHPHGLLLTGLFAGALLAGDARPRWGVRVGCMASIALAALPFLGPYLAFADRVDRAAQSGFWVLARPHEPLIYYLNLEVGTRQAGPLELALLVAAGAGLAAWSRGGQRRLAGAYGAALAALFALTFWGGAWPVTAAWQPLRLTVAIAGFSIAPAAAGLAAWWRGRRPVRLVVAAVSVALVVLAVYSGALFRGFYHVGLNADEQALVRWVAAAPPGRVLVEDSFHGGALGGGDLDAGRVVPLIPLLTGRALIGGPVADVYLKARTAHAYDGRLFGHAAAEVPDLAGMLDRYNVSALAVWSVDLYDRVRALPGVQRAGRIGRLIVFTRAAPGWALAGHADVQASPDEIRVSGAKPPASGPLVLSFHFDDRLTVDPPARLVPVPLPGDPVPFLGVDHPPPGPFSIRSP